MVFYNLKIIFHSIHTAVASRNRSFVGSHAALFAKVRKEDRAEWYQQFYEAWPQVQIVQGIHFTLSVVMGVIGVIGTNSG